ncbi:hypothetical protein Fcan01_00051 [Folsomia candida]|uniref:Uncharacterized protein n=1 Tax=Folsomia candida TaxID=158441 RepID=A0A226EYG7_FOLCA|nr:hypothetical protein Fcan01_00051 [Folsomia candida]
MFCNVFFGPVTLADRFIGLAFLVVYFIAVIVRRDYKLENSFLQLINTFLLFEADVMKDFQNCPLTIGEKVSKIMVSLCEASIAVLPALQFVLLIFETWMCYHMLVSGSSGLLYGLFVGILCLMSYIKKLGRKISANSSINDKEASVQLYRRIQILEKSVNAYVMDRIMPAYILGGPIVQIVSMFACINLHNEIKMPGFILFPMLAVDAISANTISLTLASCVYRFSKQVLQRLRNVSTCSGCNKLTKREMKSISILKIKFGSNFIDRKTPLVIQNFCLTRDTHDLSFESRVPTMFFRIY